MERTGETHTPRLTFGLFALTSKLFNSPWAVMLASSAVTESFLPILRTFDGDIRNCAAVRLKCVMMLLRVGMSLAPFNGARSQDIISPSPFARAKTAQARSAYEQLRHVPKPSGPIQTVHKFCVFERGSNSDTCAKATRLRRSN